MARALLEARMPRRKEKPAKEDGIGSERFPEVLFVHSFIGKEASGFPGTIVQSIMKYMVLQTVCMRLPRTTPRRQRWRRQTWLGCLPLQPASRSSV